MQLVATVGPASLDEPVALVTAGATALRVNASHVVPGALRPLLARLSGLAPSVPLVVDLQGAKMRLGWFAPRPIEAGAELDFARTPAAGEVPLPHAELFAASRAGDTLSCDDGRLRFRVLERGRESLRARALVPGMLRPRKGVNLVEHPVELADLTASDAAFVDEARGFDRVQWAFSFMRDGGEAAWLRRRVPGAHVIAKVERAEAIANLTAISEATDAVWICRGDLGAQLGPAALARFVGTLEPRPLPKPVLMAGQVLEHLTAHAAPTRSEVCHLFDLAARGYAGIVLSDETALGADPAGAVRQATALWRSFVP